MSCLLVFVFVLREDVLNESTQLIGGHYSVFTSAEKCLTVGNDFTSIDYLKAAFIETSFPSELVFLPVGSY